MSTAEAPVSFDVLARPYRFLEYLSFGPFLTLCRNFRIPRMRAARQALVYGDGDGRFVARLLRSNPLVAVDAVDVSAAMLSQLQRSASAAHAGRLRAIQADARSFRPLRPNYDLVVMHFFLDCFAEDELALIFARVVLHLAPRALLVVSDFAIPTAGIMARPSRMVVNGLYRAFGWLTGLPTRRLPDYSAVLTASGFLLLERQAWLGGLLRSELWQFGPAQEVPGKATAASWEPSHPAGLPR